MTLASAWTLPRTRKLRSSMPTFPNHRKREKSRRRGPERDTSDREQAGQQVGYDAQWRDFVEASQTTSIMQMMIHVLSMLRYVYVTHVSGLCELPLF